MLSQTELYRLFCYDPETGILTRRVTTGRNTKIGAVVGSRLSNGYLYVNLYGKVYLLHRLIWIYMTGEHPPKKIDHEDTNRTNNAWSNLRSASASQNAWNSGPKPCNTSGYKGVSWHKAAGKWCAQIRAGSRRVYLGLFVDPVDAHAAYCAAAAELHGDFARTA